METVFYYLGVLIFLDLVIRFPKVLKSNFGKVSETASDLMCDAIFNGAANKSSKKLINNNKFIMATYFATLLWEIVGIILSTQRLYFLMLFFLVIIFSFAAFKVSYEPNKIKHFSIMFYIVTLFILFKILTNHFLLNIN